MIIECEMILEEFITIEEFLNLIKTNLNIDSEELIEKGIVNSKDICSSQGQLLRKDAARIIYGIVYNIKGEEDCDWYSALSLKDIYDCRVCAKFIAQVYSKGIMEAWGEDYFGLDKVMTKNRAEQAIRRIKDCGERIVPEVKSPLSSGCSMQEIIQTVENGEDCLVVDVREEKEFAQNSIIQNSINIPLHRINQNPYGVGSDLNAKIFLVCTMGYKSAIAADILVKHGYRNVYHLIP